MKDYVQEKHEEGKEMTRDYLRKVVLEVWDMILPEQLLNLITSMPARCEAVKEANGGHTKN